MPRRSRGRWHQASGQAVRRAFRTFVWALAIRGVPYRKILKGRGKRAYLGMPPVCRFEASSCLPAS
jgi:hypothetical protein